MSGMSAPRANQRTVKVFGESTAAYLHLVRSWPLLYVTLDRFNGRPAYFFPAAAERDLDAWRKTCDRFMAETERVRQAMAR